MQFIKCLFGLHSIKIDYFPKILATKSVTYCGILLLDFISLTTCGINKNRTGKFDAPGDMYSNSKSSGASKTSNNCVSYTVLCPK